MDCELIESGDDVFDQPEGWFSFPYSQFIETVDDPRDLIVNSQAIGNAENQVGGCFQARMTRRAMLYVSRDG